MANILVFVIFPNMAAFWNTVNKMSLSSFLKLNYGWIHYFNYSSGISAQREKKNVVFFLVYSLSA